MQSAGKESRAATSCTECQRRKQKVRPKPIGTGRGRPLPIASQGFRLITLHSARENGLATTVKPGKFLTFASSVQKGPRLHRQIVHPGMPNLLRNNTLSFDVVTWEWNSEKSDELRGRKRSYPESTDAESIGLNGDQEEPEDGLKIWGYMPGHVHFNLSSPNRRVRIISTASEDALILRSDLYGKSLLILLISWT